MTIQIDARWLVIIFVFALSFVLLNAQSDDDPIRGYEIVSDTTRNNGVDYKTEDVSCPDDKVAIGGGAGIFFDSEEGYDLVPHLVSSFMYPDNTGWYAEAIQPEDANTDWRLEVQVICAYVEES